MPPPNPHTIPVELAMLLATSSSSSLEEVKALRKEITGEMKSIQNLKSEVEALRKEIGPALRSYARHLDKLQDEHTETITEARDAEERFRASILSALTSAPAMALWGAVGTALAGFMARYLGMI